MKKLYAVLVALAVLFSSCQRSQFATTTRTHKNGRVTYAKSYHHESRKRSKAITHGIWIKNVVMQSTFFSDRNKISVPEIAGITPVPGIQSEELIASAITDPAFIAVKGNKDLPVPVCEWSILEVCIRTPLLKLINRRQDKMTQVLRTTGRVEKLGLAGFILSIPGLVPVVCLPLAILAVIFGIISLKRIKRNPALYKGKGFAMASIILGVLGILGILLFIG